MKIINTTFQVGFILISGMLVAAPNQSLAAEEKIKILLVGDSTVTEMGDHIEPAGWNNCGDPSAQKP